MHILLENHRCVRDSCDQGGWTALHHAAQLGHLDSVQLLVAHGCTPDALDNDQQTPGQISSKNGHDAVFNFFYNIPEAGKKTEQPGGKAPFTGAADMTWCLAPNRHHVRDRQLEAKLKRADHTGDPKYNTATETQTDKDERWARKLMKRKERKERCKGRRDAAKVEQSAVATAAAANERSPPPSVLATQLAAMRAERDGLDSQDDEEELEELGGRIEQVEERLRGAETAAAGKAAKAEAAKQAAEQHRGQRVEARERAARARAQRTERGREEKAKAQRDQAGSYSTVEGLLGEFASAGYSEPRAFSRATHR
jgi:hypothetical protein